jgi:hypothetical protein
VYTSVVQVAILQLVYIFGILQIPLISYLSRRVRFPTQHSHNESTTRESHAHIWLPLLEWKTCSVCTQRLAVMLRRPAYLRRQPRIWSAISGVSQISESRTHCKWNNPPWKYDNCCDPFMVAAHLWMDRTIHDRMVPIMGQAKIYKLNSFAY